MKEIGILMSAPMVCALLREVDPKWQTRRTRGLDKLNDGYYRDRIEKVECWDELWNFWEVGHGSSAFPVFTAKCPYGVPGDRLWVKETHTYLDRHIDGVNREDPVVVGYPADDSIYRLEPHPKRITIDKMSDYGNFRLRPSIFMPRWASRITLEVTRVRVERVRNITDEDAVAEGVGCAMDRISTNFPGKWRNLYEDIWRTLNPKPPNCWEYSPWVWVIEFRKL